ncbi:hypothetical protein L9F63_010509 [Diploptera punctata]|uniref:Uncharacterized protein n=1 Tax=Diploptera punctata TaxID=6984 RepID=A0AAD8ERG0_DIPPU|nr:hypothetical protein L9F63_010509 [Diploptera punctata]
MVHKKSEYRLQFHLLGKDLRTKIWQDNIIFRESCRKLNQADHYWTYQLTDEQCECEEDGEDDDDEATLPQHNFPHCVKHKILVAKYGKEKEHNANQSLPEKKTLDAQDTAIQTPQQEERENVMQTQENLSTAVQPATQVQPSTPQVKLQEPRSHDIATKRHAIPTSPASSHLTRTSKKSYFEGKKSPFASFGWNDSDRDIGQKKTYNVYAPENEVYSAALLGLKRRREAIEKYLMEEAEKRRQELDSGKGLVNHSSIWMSEYQDKFSHGRKFVPERPKSAACHRSCNWRYS